MTSPGKLRGVFEQAAIRFDCAESDFLVLLSEQIQCYEDLFFRMPRAEDFEEFLQDVVFPRKAYRHDNGNIVHYNRPATEGQYAQWKRGADAASLRKLYHMAKQVAVKDLERLTLSTAESERKAKITLPMAMELEKKALDSGMPLIRSDRERPSMATLTKVNANFGDGGEYAYIAWERYYSHEEENFMRPGKKNELKISGEKIAVETMDEEVMTMKIESILRMQETLQIRARTHHTLGIVNYQVYSRLTEIFISKMRETVPEGMRVPSLEEIRRVDKVLHVEILKYVARGVGTLEAGLTHYTSEEGLLEKVWLLASPQLATLPDQGIHRTVPHVSAEGSKKEAPKDEHKPPKVQDVKKDKGGGKGKKGQGDTKCVVCNKARKDHPKRLFCKPPWAEAATKRKPAQGQRDDDHGPKKTKR